MAEYHPFVQGLLATLPETGMAWPIEARIAWLQAAAQNFKLIYPSEGVDIRVLADRPAETRVCAAEMPITIITPQSTVTAMTEEPDGEDDDTVVAAFSPEVGAKARELVEKVREETSSPDASFVWLWINRLWPDLSAETKGKVFMNAKMKLRLKDAA